MKLRVEAQWGAGQGDLSGPAERTVGVAFGESVDVAAYVARDACERALAALGGGNSRLRTNCALVCGPPGIGKTMLLRVLETRLRAAGTDARYVSHAALSLSELCQWMVGREGESVREAPIEALQRLAHGARTRGSAVHLVIDDANAMPLETARMLGDLVRSVGGGLCLSLAALDDARTSRMLAGLDLEGVQHRFREAMSIDEVRRYVTAHLRTGCATREVSERFADDCVERLHGLSGGNPRLLNRLAAEVARGEAGRATLMRIEPGWDDRLIEPSGADEGPDLER